MTKEIAEASATLPEDIFEDRFDTQDMDDFLSGVAKCFCPECGKAVQRNRIGRPRQFCSERCRRLWWNKHPRPENWKSTKKLICPVCGKEYLAIHDYHNERKYCSRPCANRARGKEYKNRQHENSNY